MIEVGEKYGIEARREMGLTADGRAIASSIVW